MKKILFTIVFLVTSLFICIQSAYAENFYIENYAVGLNVNTNKSVNVREVLDVVFTNQSHGIYRSIPLNGSNYVTGVNVNEMFSTERSNNLYNIKIGNPDIYVTGDKRYDIRYNYIIKDNKNEFYFNIIGTDWNTEIKNAYFKIIMPEKVDADKVGISIGSYGTKGFKDIATYSVNENVITGKILKPLPENNGITIRIEVPEGYFNNSVLLSRLITILVIFIATFLAFLIWFYYGKDKHITPVVSFYPPEGLNSAKVGMIYQEKEDIKQIISLIYYLASKGYIKIINDKNNFVIEKLKEYTGSDRVEAALMQSLFKGKVQISKTDLEYSQTFYKEIKEIENEAKNFKKQIFNEESIGVGKNIIMAISLIVSACSVLFVCANYDFNLLIESSSLLFFIIPFLVIFLNGMVNANSFKKLFLLGVLFVFGFNFIPFIPSLNEDLPVIIMGIVSVIIIGICWKNLPQWTDEAINIKGQILGFKKFIEVSEKHRIEQLMKENPNYCSDLIPYAFVLGIVSSWIDKITPISSPPVWFSGEFNHYTFNNFSEAFHSVSIPSVSNGGISESTSSSGGGGFSGGGHGGGGGGSW